MSLANLLETDVTVERATETVGADYSPAESWSANVSTWRVSFQPSSGKMQQLYGAERARRMAAVYGKPVDVQVGDRISVDEERGGVSTTRKYRVQQVLDYALKGRLLELHVEQIEEAP